MPTLKSGDILGDEFMAKSSRRAHNKFRKGDREGWLRESGVPSRIMRGQGTISLLARPHSVFRRCMLQRAELVSQRRVPRMLSSSQFTPLRRSHKLDTARAVTLLQAVRPFGIKGTTCGLWRICRA